uniref:ribonuclease H n=1 Tax=Crocodylus porosus TaxID=8502 RepID=A0A7M4FCI5_CROPO
MSVPIPIEFGILKLSHKFVVMPGGPANLLGRDVLGKLGACIQCGPEGFCLIVPEEAVESLLALSNSFPDIPKELQEIPQGLWSMDPMDVGLLKSATQVCIKVKDGSPPLVKQYPLPRETEEGISVLIDSYVLQGVLVPCSSPCNTPILPVKKPKPGPNGKPIYRFVQDLHAINNHVIVPHPVVPDPSTILTLIPCSANCFTVVGLCAAFFSILLHPESQYLFAFTWKGKQLTRTRLPQGFAGSPMIFSRILTDDLKDIVLPAGSILVQYVDDLLLASPDCNACLSDSVALLKALALKGHHASPSKLQLCKIQVNYLGFVIRPGE